MKKNHKSKVKRIIALSLASIMVLSMLSGCGKTDIKNESQQPGITTEEIASIITEEIQNFTEETQEEIHSDTDSIVEEGSQVVISDDWRDYVGDIDTFVYGLLINEYSNIYDVFNAMIELPDGSEIYGIGYTDYNTYLESDDGTGCFPAGFISLIGESSIPSVYASEGLEIQNTDFEDEKCKFVYAYDCYDFMEHCVVWGQYLKYGVKAGVITYECTEFAKAKCDEDIGALYSYDDDKYLYDPNVGEYVRVTGTSLSESIDYDELQAKVDEIIENQDKYFSEVDIESSAYIAQEAINSYLLSMQEEKFLGYDVKELIKISSELDPMECIQLTPDGIICIDASETLPENNPTEFTKWMTGICCGLVVVGCIALDIFVPALAPLSGAIMSAAIEVFTEVVIQNNQIKNVNWAKVGVAAVSGALIAWACPAVASSATSKAVSILGKTFKAGTTKAISEVCGYAVLAFSNAIVAGSTNAAFAYLDGKGNEDIYDAFVMGAAIGGAMTIAASVAAEAGSVAMNAFKNSHPNNWLVKLGDKASTFIGNHQYKVFKNAKIEDILIPKSIHQSAESAYNEIFINRPERIKQLPSDNNPNILYRDKKGNQINKSKLLDNGGNGVLDISNSSDPQIKKFIKETGISSFQIKDGYVQFDNISECSISAKITSNRKANMNNAYDILAKKKDSLPGFIKDELNNQKIDLNNIKTDEQYKDLAKKIEGIVKEEHVLHESETGQIYIINKYIHKKISHSGGVAQAKSLEMIKVGTNYMKELYSSSAIRITGTLLLD